MRKGLVLGDICNTYSPEEAIEVKTGTPASLPGSPCFLFLCSQGPRSKFRCPETSPPIDAQRGLAHGRPSESRSLLWGPLWQVFPSLGQLVA